MQTIHGRYEIERELGRGAFGHTYLARDLRDGALVAMKLFNPRRAPDLKAVELFTREAEVLRGLRHHGVPAVLDAFTTAHADGEHAALVMEFIDGESLAQMISARQVHPPERVLELMLGLLDVIEYLHSRVPPLLHRDIKPSNIIVRPNGTPVLIDFGSVRRVFMHEEEAGSTIAGTYGYMPYEQFMGQASASSDLYALAATMLHLITGRPPRDFMGEDGALEVPDSLTGDPRVISALRRMLRAAPASRFATAREARQAILFATERRDTPRDVAGHVTGDAPPAVRSLVPTSRAAAMTGLPAFSDARPRPLTPPLQEMLRAQAPRMFALMDTSRKPNARTTMSDWLAIGFFSVVTLGVLPLVFYGYARARRKRLELFLSRGMPTLATILEITSEPTAFGEKIALVKYKFEADGALHRDADQLPPIFAHRMAPGDVMHALYIPEDNYDSVLLV